MAKVDCLLVERAREGDQQAVAGLFERYRLRVIRFCLTFAPIREADAHDLTQEVFVRTFKGIRKLREPERFESWLFSIARRRCMTFLRNLSRRRAGQQELALAREKEGPPDVEAQRMKRLERKIVAEEIERLPESSMKQAGRMFYLEDQDTSTIARQLDAPISTVTTWLSRFRGKIRRRLVLRIMALRGHQTGEETA